MFYKLPDFSLMVSCLSVTTNIYAFVEKGVKYVQS